MEIKENDYLNCRSTIVNRIEDTIQSMPEKCEDEFKAFPFLMSKLFSNGVLDETLFVLDKKSDQGIDFYAKYAGSYEIFQCKFADLERIITSDKPLSYDQTGVRDLENAYHYLIGDQSVKTGNKDVEKVRAQIMAEDCKEISFNLCVFGKLTDDAREKFQLLQKEYGTEYIDFNLFEWQDIAKELFLQYASPKETSFTFRVKDNQILHKQEYCYFLCNVKDFYDVFQKFGWSLFDLNVRSELSGSPINNEIIKSLKHDKSMKFFHHLNNGILIFCNNFSFTKRPKPKTNGNGDEIESIEIKNFQIINGCQTVLAINRAFEEICHDKFKFDRFDKDCLVQVKVISKTPGTKEIIDDVIISTNNQNPMKKRNLKSNKQEQRKIKAYFDNLTPRWFYQRKDGEFNSFKSMPHVGTFQFRISDYKEGNISRCIDNNDLAKTWLCFIGFPDKSMMTSDYFIKDTLYSDIFQSKPTQYLWDEFLNPDTDFQRKDNYFDVGKLPIVEEYLLSYVIWNFIKSYSLSPRDNKKEALNRGVRKGVLHRATTEDRIIESVEDQSQYLKDDDEYVLNNIINNSKEVFLSMYAFVLVRKYGYNPEIAKKLIRSKYLGGIQGFAQGKIFSQEISELGNNLLVNIYEFLRFVLGQVYTEIKSEYLVHPRRKYYLSQQRFITKFKKKILELNNQEGFKMYSQNWKTMGLNFFESMPDELEL